MYALVFTVSASSGTSGSGLGTVQDAKTRPVLVKLKIYMQRLSRLQLHYLAELGDETLGLVIVQSNWHLNIMKQTNHNTVSE